MNQECVICGEKAVGFFAENPKLPLCPNVACETALIDKINTELQDAAAEAAKENQCTP